jgi:hypothetical protein
MFKREKAGAWRFWIEANAPVRSFAAAEYVVPHTAAATIIAWLIVAFFVAAFTPWFKIRGQQPADAPELIVAVHVCSDLAQKTGGFQTADAMVACSLKMELLNALRKNPEQR